MVRNMFYKSFSVASASEHIADGALADPPDRPH